MENRRDDVRTIALIAGAGLIGMMGTALVLRAPTEPGMPAEQPQDAMFWLTPSSAPPAPESAPAAPEAAPHLPAPHLPGLHLPGLHLPEHPGTIVSGTTRIRADRILLMTGVRSFEAPAPVVYIDGVRVDGSMEQLNLNPDRIARVEVIKGPAAKREYGSEAEGGVIQVFLKPDSESDNKASGSGR